jgi:hypothetical protein
LKFNLKRGGYMKDKVEVKKNYFQI